MSSGSVRKRSPRAQKRETQGNAAAAAAEPCGGRGVAVGGRGVAVGGRGVAARTTRMPVPSAVLPPPPLPPPHLSPALHHKKKKKGKKMGSTSTHGQRRCLDFRVRRAGQRLGYTSDRRAAPSPPPRARTAALQPRVFTKKTLACT